MVRLVCRRVPAEPQSCPTQVTVGDNVLYGQQAGSEAVIEGKKYKLVRAIPACACAAGPSVCVSWRANEQLRMARCPLPCRCLPASASPNGKL